MGKHGKNSRDEDRDKKSKKKRKRRKDSHLPLPAPAELLIAAGLGDANRCKALLKAGADPNWADGDLSTPLHTASREGNIDVAKVLLKKGALTTAEDLRGDTPAHVAARQRHLGVLTQLLKAGPADLLTQRNDKGETVQQLMAEAIESRETQRYLREESMVSQQRKRKKKRQRRDAEGSLCSDSLDSSLDDGGSLESDSLSGGDEDEAWRQRLEREMSPDTYGAYYDPSTWHADEYETPDQYARRIWEEIESKRRRQAAADAAAETLRDAKSYKEEEAQKQHAKRESRRILLEEQQAADVAWRAAVIAGLAGPKLASYTARWEFFCTKQDPTKRVMYRDVPWVLPDREQSETPEELGKVLLHGLGALDIEERRHVLRRELVRWHPDKFIAQFGRRLDASDRDRILQRVTGTSQALNALHAEVQGR